METGKSIFLSIIVPVYQVEPYIRACLDSILDQKFTDFELILVDDGSFDSSPGIVDDYAKNDERVKVVHQINGGLSKARNTGLDIARGKYVAFVDSDDCIDSEMYEHIIACMEANSAQIGECGFVKFLNNCEILQRATGDGNTEILSNNAEIFREFIDNKTNYIFGIVWNKVYERLIFESPEKLRFKENTKAEDGEIILKILNRCEKYALVNRHFYYYRQRQSDSITANRGRDLGLRKDAVNALLTQFEIISEKGFEPDEIKEFLWRNLKVMINSYFVVEKELRHKNEAQEILRKIKPVIKITINTNIKTIQKIILRIFYLSPNLFWYMIGKWYKIYYARTAK